MGLKRVGTVLFGLGLLLAALTAAIGEVEVTEVASPASTPAWLVVLGLLGLLAGIVVGGVGVGRDLADSK
jgi:uncharacterized membrane protein